MALSLLVEKKKDDLLSHPTPTTKSNTTNTSSTLKMRKIMTRPITPSFPSWRLRVYHPNDKNDIVLTHQNFATLPSTPPPPREENASSETSAEAWPRHISMHNKLHRSSCSKMRRLLLQPPEDSSLSCFHLQQAVDEIAEEDTTTTITPRHISKHNKLHRSSCSKMRLLLQPPEDSSLSCFHLQQAVDEIAEEDTATITTSSTTRTSRSAPREAESNNDRCCPERTSQRIRHLSEPPPASADASIEVSTNAADRRRELQLRALREAYLAGKGSSVSAEDVDDDDPCFSKPGAYPSYPTKTHSESTRKEDRRGHALVVPTAAGAPQPALLQTGALSGDRRRRLQLRALREAYLDRKSSSMSAD